MMRCQLAVASSWPRTPSVSVLDLDRDAAAVEQACAIDLADRRCDGVGLERVEDVVQGLLELVLDHAPHPVEADTWGRVAQRREFGLEAVALLGRQVAEVDDRGDLADLHRRALHAAEHVDDLLGRLDLAPLGGGVARLGGAGRVCGPGRVGAYGLPADEPADRRGPQQSPGRHQVRVGHRTMVLLAVWGQATFARPGAGASEPQQRGDRALLLDVGVDHRQVTHARVLAEGAAHRGLDDVVDDLGLGAVGGALAAGADAHPAALRAARPLGREALLDHQRVDAPLVDGLQDWRQAGDRAPAGRRGLGDALQQLLVAARAQLVEDGPRRLQDVVGAGVPHVDVEVALHAAGDLGVQEALELLDGLLLAADDQAGDRRLAQPPPQLARHGAQVVLGLLGDAALVARLRPAALIVLALGLVVLAPDLDEAVGRPGQQPHPPAVDERQPPQLAG